MTKRWIFAPVVPGSAEPLARELGLPLPLAQTLVNRGYRDAAAARRFLAPQLRHLDDPFALPDLAAAVDRILAAIARRQRIVIFGDYDVDGITATALLLRVLQLAGATVASFLPHRLEEGYGLSAAGLARCQKDHAPELLIAVDCGTNAVAEIAALQGQGIETIVLDHHEPSARLPECVALVNPKRADGVSGQSGVEPSRSRPPAATLAATGGRGLPSPAQLPPESAPVPHGPATGPAVPWRSLASVGVAFKVAHGLQKRGRERNLAWAGQLDLREHLDLVALGTVADIVPLTGENRILVQAGLERLARTDKPGLRALLEVAAVHGAVSPYHIGFRLGPRLNAAGRLGDAPMALELLLTADPARAGELAGILNDHNTRRQQIEERMVGEALAMVRSEIDREQERVLVLAREGWHAGVVGIVASRVLQEFYRPTVVIGIEHGLGKGSCRSIAGFSMVAALQHCAATLERFGGHEMAAGLSVKAGQIAELRRALNVYAAGILTADDLQPRLRLDATVRLAELDGEFFKELRRFQPCGPDNPTPVFAVRGVRLQGPPRVVGKNHLKFAVTDGETVAAAIWWGQGNQSLPAGEFALAFVPELNSYQGVETLQLQVRDVRAVEPD